MNNLVLGTHGINNYSTLDVFSLFHRLFLTIKN